MEVKDVPEVYITQTVAILIDGNNIERSLHKVLGNDNAMLNFDNVIPKLLGWPWSHPPHLFSGKAFRSRRNWPSDCTITTMAQ